MTGQGGWPLNVFLTPEQVPFFAGTYFPPESRMGMPSWRSVLDAVASAWDERRDEIREGGERIAERLRGGALLHPSEQRLRRGARSTRPSRRCGASYDRANGGFGASAQVPARLGDRVPAAPRRDRDDRATRCARWPRAGCTTRSAAASRATRSTPTGSSPTSRRCSTTTRCSRARTCTAGRSPASRCSGPSPRRRSTGRCARCAAPRAASTPRSTPTPRARRASSTSGAVEEMRAALEGEPDADEAIAWFGATDRGNFEGSNIPVRGPGEPERRDEWRRRLYDVRAERVWPGLDDKRLTSWNALMISALADAGAVLERDDYLDAARAAADFVLARAARRRRPAAAQLEGRPRQAERLPRGPRVPARGAAVAVRGDASSRAGSPRRARSRTR